MMTSTKLMSVKTCPHKIIPKAKLCRVSLLSADTGEGSRLCTCSCGMVTLTHGRLTLSAVHTHTGADTINPLPGSVAENDTLFDECAGSLQPNTGAYGYRVMPPCLHGGSSSVPEVCQSKCIHLSCQISKGVFCRVRVLSVGYEILYRTYRIIGYRYESLTETTERSGTGMRILQKLQNLSGTVRYAYRKPAPVVVYFSKYKPAPRVRVRFL